jgi:alpha-glucosidase
MKKIMLPIILALNILTVCAKDYKISSPDGKIVINVSVGSDIKWSATYENKEILSSVKTAMILDDGKILGNNETVKKSLLNHINEILKPEVAYKKSETVNNCNALLLTFKTGFSIQFRAYNEGIAYRFETAFKDSLVIKNEISELEFPSGTKSWYPLEKGFMSHNENIFIFSSLDTITNKHLASLPVLFQSDGTDILLTESDIEDYAGMWVRGAGSGKIQGTWPAYPAEETLSGDRNLRVTKTKDYIAKTEGTRTFPWRVFVIAGEDGKLIESDLVYKLAAPNRLKETGWIKPGKVAWDWWNANNIYGVDFKSGINNETYKYYIDFASKNGIEYVVLDEGWYKLGNVLEVVPGMNIPELCRYAADKNVGIILWVVWKSFYDKMDQALDQFTEMGCKGVKSISCKGMIRKW